MSANGWSLMTSPQAGWLKFSASGHPPIPDIASIIQDAATWPRACAPSSIWPRRWSFGIARRLEGHRTGGPFRGTCAATGRAERRDWSDDFRVWHETDLSDLADDV